MTQDKLEEMEPSIVKHNISAATYNSDCDKKDG